MDPYRTQSDSFEGKDKVLVNDLALFGGPPLFQHYLHVGRPNIPEKARFLERVNDVIERKWLTNDGPEAKEFERRIAEFIGVRHCVAACNGTIALQIAICAAGLRGEVILPSFTFVATAHALQWQGIQPVFCDIDDTLCLDPYEVERLITPRTTAVIGVHLWGHACQVDALRSITGRHNLKLIFDAAHAFGCSHNGEMIGRFGDAEIFSFHATKFVNSLEGGAIVTNDDSFASRCRSMRNFGFEGEDQVITLGINGKMNEIEAAMGLASLDEMDSFIGANEANYSAYKRELEGIQGIRLLPYDLCEKNNFQYIAIEVGTKAGISRDLLHQLMQAENIFVRRYFYPGCHRMEPYRSQPCNAGLVLANTDRIASAVLCLPTGTSVDAKTIRVICAILRFAVHNQDAIHERLGLRGSINTQVGNRNEV